MENLVSKQHTNDGGYHIKRLVNEANSRLKQIGRQGKRATIVAKKSSLSLQFTFKDGDGRSQKNPGLGAIPVSAKGILEAEKIAQLVTGQLAAGTFTWDWFNSLIGKPTSEQNKQLTCKEMVEEFKKHFFKQRKDDKCPKASWKARGGKIEDILGTNVKSLSPSIIRKIIEETPSHSVTRRAGIQGLVEFLKYFDNSDYKEIIKEYKANNKPKAGKKNVPSDKRIIEVYNNGFCIPTGGNPQYHRRPPQWQFLYGLLATYGLRVHEAWNIANWDKPVTLKNGDWARVDMDSDSTVDVQRSGEDVVIPAILDPSNEKHLLCIGHETKTGYRVAVPLSPSGHNWINEFNLLQPLNLPDIENPLEKQGESESTYNCTSTTGGWFYRKKYGFTPHALRHAYNHRGHHLGFNPKVLADSLGHSMKMNGDNYLRHMSDDVKLQGMLSAIDDNQVKGSQLELLEAENKGLKTQLEAKNNEIRLLKVELKMYQTLEESKG